MTRVIVVANRLPVTVKRSADGITLAPSTGGLATGLRSVHDRTRDVWIGWPGITRERLSDEEAQTFGWAELGCVPVSLSTAEVKGYYQKYANGVIWPLFHGQLTRMPLMPPAWDVYESVNAKFADLVCERLQSQDLVWVHDYQLMRVPHLIRKRHARARIGFFLHIPFPSVETFCTLPDRIEILEGLLGADVIGFHTAAYLQNFVEAVLHLLGVSAHVDTITWHGRRIRLGVFPMGIDAEYIATRSSSPEVSQHVRQLKGDGLAKILLGIDRIDYTKGIPRRLLAFEQLLQNHPRLHGKIRLVQLGVPSRTGVPEYRRYARLINGLIGRINGEFGTPTWVPVHYLVRSLSNDEVIALYRAAQVMVVTPLRDGMNLVAKEYVASRTDGDGVLVLSEFAGASVELGEALQVNPYDVRRTADALYRAITMDPGERRTRMRALRSRVSMYTADRWAQAFLTTLRRHTADGTYAHAAVPPTVDIDVLERRVRDAAHVTLLLDYDGTLIPFTSVPLLATPDAELLRVLTALAHRPQTTLHVVSGRARDTLTTWLGSLPISLHAEHGLWSRHFGSTHWERRAQAMMPRRSEILHIFTDLAARVPGSLVEEKSAGLAWHYRPASPAFAERQAHALCARLYDLLSNEPVEVLIGNKVIEVRPHGVHKGLVAQEVLKRQPENGLLIAIGDDRTDEDLFAALPSDAVTIHVGESSSAARFRMNSISDVRMLLRRLVDLR